MRFQWLRDYQDLEEQLLYLKWNLNKSKLELIRWTTGDLSKVRIEKTLDRHCSKRILLKLKMRLNC